MSITAKHRSVGIVVALILIATAGCGGTGDRPPLGEVNGTVTLSGQPLFPCKVTMHSLDKGRMSVGYTNEEGEYTMAYLGDVEGVKAGECNVYITTALGDDEPGGPSRQMLPGSYWGKGTVLKTNIVANEDNVINWALTPRGAPPE